MPTSDKLLELGLCHRLASLELLFEVVVVEVGLQVAPLVQDSREAQAAEGARLRADGAAGRGGRGTRRRRRAGTIEIGL